MLSTILHNKKWQEIIIFSFIIGLGSFLRFYLLPGNMPFIGDQAKDFFSAVRMVEEGEVPLLGIESSMPQFRQGPVYIWLLAFFFAVFGFSPENSGYFAASIGTATIGVLYITTRNYFGRKPALYASALLAVSPLAVAHSQLSFMINPIPLISVAYLVSLLKYVSRKKENIFLPAVWFGLLFQFELAHAPLIMLLPASMLIKRIKLTDWGSWKSMISGLILGLLPQIVYDITHQFKHLSLFAGWVGYRLGSFFMSGSEHVGSVASIQSSLEKIMYFTHKIVSFDSFVFICMGVVLLVSLMVWILRKDKWQSPIALVWLWIIILIASFVVHRSPSEAYFPVFMVPLTLAIGWSLSQAKTSKGSLMAIFLVGLTLVVNVRFITKSEVLSKSTTSTSGIPSDAWQPRLDTQQAIVELIMAKTRGPIRLRSIGSGSEFPSFLDNFKYILWQNEVMLSDDGSPVWLIFGPLEDYIFPNTKSFKIENITVVLPL